MTAPVPPPTAETAATPPDGRSRQRTIIAVLVALALVAVAVVGFQVLTTDDVGASQVTLRAYADPGPDPFTSSVAADSRTLADYAENGPPDEAVLAVNAADTTTSGYQTIDGAVPGVFGGTLNELACDSAQLVGFLGSEPDKAALWAGVLEIDAADIASYVDGLTAANLASDTRVLDHGWSGDGVEARETILQRGTAVMVDARGVPRVNCYSGNPLLDPNLAAEETFEGQRWSSFQPGKTLVIKPSVSVASEFVLVDVEKGTAFTRPAGSTGEADVDPTIAETPTPEPTPVPVTRDLPDAGEIPLGATIPAEITPDAPALIYQVDVPPGSVLRITVTNDRASISRVALDLSHLGEELTFFRTAPNATEVFEIILDDTRSGLFDLEFTEGPAAFEFLAEAVQQDDGGSGGDAPAEFADAVSITSGQRVEGILGDRDGADRYVLDLEGAPSLEVTVVVPRTSERRAAIGVEFVGDSLLFDRVAPGGDLTWSLLMSPEDQDLLELVVTEGQGAYELTAELVPQSDGNQRGDASAELVDARQLSGDLSGLQGEVGDRDQGDLYLFEAPGDEITLEFGVAPDAPRRVAFSLIRPDGSSQDFERLEPGVTETFTYEVEEGGSYRLLVTEGRGVYTFSID